MSTNILFKYFVVVWKIQETVLKPSPEHEQKVICIICRRDTLAYVLYYKQYKQKKECHLQK